MATAGGCATFNLSEASTVKTWLECHTDKHRVSGVSNVLSLGFQGKQYWSLPQRPHSTRPVLGRFSSRITSLNRGPRSVSPG